MDVVAGLLSPYLARAVVLKCNLKTQPCLQRNPAVMLSYALRIASFASGIGFAGYHKLFGRHLGMNVATDKVFHRVIAEAYALTLPRCSMRFTRWGGDEESAKR